MRVEFLLEEASMENVLRKLLPEILPDSYELDVNCFLRPHQGKSDLKNWNEIFQEVSRFLSQV